MDGGIVKGVDGNSLAGIWTWKDGAVKPGAGTAEYTAIFTSSDVKNYTAAEVNVSVTTKESSVDPSKVTPPTANPITYGQSLSEAVLVDGSVTGITGTWSWAEPDTKPNAGYHNYIVLFTPDDVNIEVWSNDLNVTVNKATPVLNDEDMPHASDIFYGQRPDARRYRLRQHYSLEQPASPLGE